MADSIQTKLFYHFSIATAIVFLLFGSIYLFQGRYLLGGFEASLGAAQFLNLWFMRRFANAKVSSRVLIGSVYMMSLIIFVTGGLGNTGFLWIQFIPVFTMLLLDHSEAKRWVLFYTVILALLVITHLFITPVFPYPDAQLRQSMIVYLIFIYLTYYNEKLKEIARNKLQEQNEELITLSRTDALTHLYNRRYMAQVLNDEFYRARRYRSPLSVIIRAANFRAASTNVGSFKSASA